MGWSRSWINEILQAVDERGHHRIARSIQLFVAIGDKLVGDHALRWAASLTFTTILSLMPLLAVVFSVLQAFLPNQFEEIKSWLFNALFTDSVSGVTEHIEAALTTNQGTIGIVGLAILVIVSILLFLSVENAFNDIWNVPKSRPMYRRLLTFYAVITLTPTLLALGSVAASRLMIQLGITYTSVYLAGVVNLTLVVFVLTLLTKLLPHTYVNMKYALISAVIAAVVFQLGRFGFNLYVDTLYEGSIRSKVYGSFALIPIFLLWIYVCWIIVLSGASLAYMLQNRERLTRDFDIIRRTGHLNEAPSGRMLCTVFLEVANHFYSHGGHIEQRRIADRLQIDEIILDRCIETLKSNRLLSEVIGDGPVCLLPSQSLSQLTVADVYKLGCHQTQLKFNHESSYYQAFDKLESQANVAAQDLRKSVTIASLIELKKDD